jgi:hypothetical protein
MGFQILPNSLGSLGAGSGISQLTGPLSSLFNSSTINNLVYPSDLASNPAMCHAVQFSIYDYTTGFEQAVNSGINSIQNGSLLNGLKNTVAEALEIGKTAIGLATDVKSAGSIGEAFTNATNYAQGQIANAATNAAAYLPSALSLAQAPTYRPKAKGSPLATVSLYMPDSLKASHNAHYSEINFTDALGIASPVVNAIAENLGKSRKDIMNYLPQSGYGKTAIASLTGLAAGAIGGNSNDIRSVAQNALGVYTNPQIQLIYKGINLREFSLDFVFTPKSPQEAQTTKNIIDTFTFYSVPGLGSAAIDGQPGQYLTPPQLFQIKFVFLGQNGIGGSVASVFSSALSNLGLGSLLTSDPTNTITNGSAAKIMTIQECVLESVDVDYAPNGWAAFNDGYGVQTTLSLKFKETQILTKDKVGNPDVAGNYATKQQFNKAITSVPNPSGSTAKNSGWGEG